MRSIFDDVDYEKDVPKKLRELVDKYPDFANKFILDGIKASVYLWGDVGTGKTRAAYAIKKRLDEKVGTWFTSIHNFTNLVVRVKLKPESDDDISLDEISGFKGLLIIDDFGAKNPTNATIDNVYVILNYRYEHMLPTIITSNLPILGIEQTFGNRISSRIDRMAIDLKLE
jgi:DNA replication protein DnaC